MALVYNQAEGEKIYTYRHFLYDNSDHNKIIGLFSAVNESTWEYIKITLVSTLLWGLLGGFIYVHNPYFYAKFSSLAVIIIFMQLLCYGYKTHSEKFSMMKRKKNEKVL